MQIRNRVLSIVTVALLGVAMATPANAAVTIAFHGSCSASTNGSTLHAVTYQPSRCYQVSVQVRRQPPSSGGASWSNVKWGSSYAALTYSNGSILDRRHGGS